MAQQNAHPTTVQAPRRRRRLWRTVALVLVLAVALPIGALWVRLSVQPMTLPAGLQTRIEARINDAMASGELVIGDMVLALPEGGRAPALEFRDVALTGPSGGVRAALPFLRVRVAPGPLLRGQVRVRRVVVSGAGVNLRRSADGRLDLDFAGAGMGADPVPGVGATPGDGAAGGDPRDTAPVSLAETLRRLDRMVSEPVFSALDEVQGVGMEVLLSDDLTGRVLRLHSAEMRLARSGDGRLDLILGGQLAGSRDTTLRIGLMRDAQAGQTQMRMSFDTLAARDVAAASPALAWLDLMRAPIDGELTASMADDGSLGAMRGTLRIGAGHLTLPGQTAPLGFTAMEAAIAYDPVAQRVRFDRLRLAADQLSFTAQGHAVIREDGAMFTGQFSLTDILAAPAGLFDAPVAIDGAAMDLRLHLGEAVRVDLGEAVIFDGDLRASLRGHALADATGLTLAIDAAIPEADLPTILSYWPASAIPNTRWWVSERLLRARASGVDFAFRQSPGAGPSHELSFDFSGADIRALPAAPPILGASGYLNLHDQMLVVGLSGGGVGAEGQGQVALAGSRMVIGDVSQRGPLARFDLALSGAVPDLMHLLAGPPFAVLDASGFAPDEIGTGRIDARASLATHLSDTLTQPTLPELGVQVSGHVTGFAATELIAGRVLTSDRLTVTMTPETLAIGGPGALDGVPVTGQWTVALGPDAAPGSTVTARAPITRAALATFGVALPDWLIAGAGEADLTVALQADRPATLSVRSDLAGVSLAIPPLAWRLPAERTGAFAAEIRLGPDPAVTALTLEAVGLSLDGAVSFTAEGGLDRLTAARFRLGQWLDVQGALVGRRNAGPAIEVAGGAVDFRTMPSLANVGGPSGDMGPLAISLDRLQITGGIALTDLRADLDGATMSGGFRGRVNGAAAVIGQLVPSANGPSVRLQSDDGGAVMRAAGIFENLHGGPMDLILAARPEAGQYDGRLTVDGPRLRDAPVMAELLNAISVVGLLEQLSGDGINMGEVSADFRIAPDRITVAQGTAVGPSLGISMDGVYDIASERYEMQGVVSPLYMVNGLLGALFAPRREGLFGFNYRLSGSAQDTRVSVNPLSILTPGIFREIFRAPPPDFTPGAGGGSGQ